MTADDDERDATPDGVPEVALDAEIAGLLGEAGLWAAPADDLGERIVAAVRSEAVAGPPPAGRPARGWLRPAALGAAAVVAFLFVGIAVLSALDGPSGAEQFTAELVPTGLVADVDGSIEMTALDSGVRIELDAPSLPRRVGDQFYEAWLRTADGMLIPVGTFRGGDGVTLWAGVEWRQVRAFSVTMEEAVAADSVDQRTSGRVVLKADIAAP